jgi:putative membrane protein
MMKQFLQSRYKFVIWALSALIPVVVAILFRVRLPEVEPLMFLPPIYAGINAITAVLLVAAVLQIKKGNRALHERLMSIAILCSIAFLVMYVAYHMTSDPTPYGGEGFLRGAYYFILISHIILSISVIPLVLFTYFYASTEQFVQHKKIAKITFPIWLYVAVTGVIVYLMIAPYYA